MTLAARADGSVSGDARFIPYTADGARLALDPVRFSGGKGGAMRFATRADLSGPLADGRVEGLALPLAGVMAPTGDIARSEEHTSGLQSLMRTPYAVFCL